MEELWNQLIKLHKELQQVYKKTDGDESKKAHQARKKAQTKVKNQAKKIGMVTFAAGGRGSEDFDELMSQGGKLPSKDKYSR